MVPNELGGEPPSHEEVLDIREHAVDRQQLENGRQRASACGGHLKQRSRFEAGTGRPQNHGA